MKKQRKAIALIILLIVAFYAIIIKQDNQYQTYAQQNGCTWYYINGFDVCK